MAEAARSAVERLRIQPGFRDHPRTCDQGRSRWSDSNEVGLRFQRSRTEPV